MLKKHFIVGLSTMVLASGAVMVATTTTMPNQTVQAAQVTKPGYLAAGISGNRVWGTINRGANVYIRQNGKLIKTIAAQGDTFAYTLPAVSQNATITISTWKPGYTRAVKYLTQTAPAAKAGYLNVWVTGNTLHGITNQGATVYIHQNGKSIKTINQVANVSGFSYDLPMVSKTAVISVTTYKPGYAWTTRTTTQAGQMAVLMAQDTAAFKAAMTNLPDDVFAKLNSLNNRNYSTTDPNDLTISFRDVLGGYYSNLTTEDNARSLAAINQLTNYYKKRLSAADYAQLTRLVEVVDTKDSSQFWREYMAIISNANYGIPTVPLNATGRLMVQDTAAFKAAMLQLPDDVFAKLNALNYRDYSTTNPDDLTISFRDVLGGYYSNLTTEDNARSLAAINQLTAYYKNRLDAADYAQLTRLVAVVDTKDSSQFWREYMAIVNNANYGIPTVPLNATGRLMAQDTAAFKAAMLQLPDDVFAKLNALNYRNYSTTNPDDLTISFRDVLGGYYSNLTTKDDARSLAAINQLTAYYKNRLDASDYAQLTRLVAVVNTKDSSEFWREYMAIISNANY